MARLETFIFTTLLMTTTLLTNCMELTLDDPVDLLEDSQSSRNQDDDLDDLLDLSDNIGMTGTRETRSIADLLISENGVPKDLSDLLPKEGEDRTLAKSRKKRATLVWPSGSIFVAEFYFTIPITAPTGVTIPFTIDVPYKFTLPNITSSFFDRRANNRGSKNDGFHDRLDVYGVVEGLFNQFGMDGKACMLRAVCEKAESNLVHTGMLGEVIATILAASASDSSQAMYEYQMAEYYGTHYGDCHSIYSECPMSLFNWLE